MATSSQEYEAKFELLAASIHASGYAVMDDFMDAPSCKILLLGMQALQAKGLLRKAGIGMGSEYQRNETIRGDEIFWIEKSDEAKIEDAFLHQLHTLMVYFNRSCYAGIRDYEAHFAAYAPNAFYKRHRDQLKGNGNRKFTFIFYLNADWKQADGGELRMYLPSIDQESSIDISPISGRFVCFLSDEFEHEVLITHVQRYSITGWWLDQEKDLGFLR